jgi:hypothetical protein
MKKRKGFRRITISNTEHWQWTVGKQCIVAYCDETGEKRLTTDVQRFYCIGLQEHWLNDEFYSYVSPGCIRAWLTGQPFPPPKKVQHPVFERTYVHSK